MNLVSKSLVSALVLSLGVVACDEQKPAPTSTSTPTAAASAVVNTAASVAKEAVKEIKLVSNPAAPASFDIDLSHSKVGFSVKHMMISNTIGRFGKFSGTVFLNEAKPADSTVNIEIDTSSINTDDAKRDGHLMSPDFFDSKKFPKMTFKSTKVERALNGYKVTGDLTIKDVTKSVVLETEEIAPEIKSPFGSILRATTAHTKINRKEFGLTWNKALETGGGVLVGEDVSINLEVELVKKAEATAAGAAGATGATPAVAPKK